MRRIMLALGIAGFLVVVVSAQPVMPPGSPPPAPVSPPPPPAEPAQVEDIPIKRFEPLNSYPAPTQFAIRGVLIGSTWMVRMHQPHGRFMHGYNPALRQPLNGVHDLKQAQAALVMAQSAKFCGDLKQTAIANQTILALLAATRIDPADPACRVPVQSSAECNRVAFAALVAMAIYELPNAPAKLLDDAERLCVFIRRHLRSDGSVHYIDSPTDSPTQVDPEGLNLVPGIAIHALLMSHAVRPSDWKLDAGKRGVAHYHAVFRAKPHPMLAATLTPAATELYLQTKQKDALSAVLEMNDWLCSLQISPTDPHSPQWAGGFRRVINNKLTTTLPETTEQGMYVKSLACAYQLIRQTGDLNREGQYRPVLTGAVEFLCGLQYQEANTRHFENSFRANILIGGFHLTPEDGNLRIDATAGALGGLLRFLSSGAERH